MVTSLTTMMNLIRFNVKCSCRYDVFFLSMLAISAFVVSINWERYHLCKFPLCVWIAVDYATIFTFRILMFLDSGLAAGLGLHTDNIQALMRFKGRVIVLVCLALVLYPFLWTWTVIGSVWFNSARSCVPEGQKWGFLVWLLFSYCGLICIACLSAGKWLIRRQIHLQRATEGSRVSEWQVLVDLIRVPDRVIEAADPGQEMRGGGLDTATYHPGLFLTPAQKEVVEGLIQQLPKFRLKAVPTECSECPICLEEFQGGDQVRGLPCAHNFHVACIDEWLRLNIKCPRCRCSVFPNLDLSALGGSGGGNNRQPRGGVTSIYFGGDAAVHTSVINTPGARYVRGPIGESNLFRLQEILRTMQIENALYSEQAEAAMPSRDGSVDVSLRLAASRPNPYMLSDTVVVVERSPPARF